MQNQESLAGSLDPVTRGERIESLDVLRGFAVMGILVMNIQAFAMPGAAYMNPTAYGDLSGANYWVWLTSHVLMDMKFMAIFSMLFGAGIVLMTSRRRAATGRSAGVHYRRMGWLVLFGLLHAYLLWYGDILFTYAMCGLLVYLMRRWRPTVLIILGALMLAIGSRIWIFFHWSMQFWPPNAVQEMESYWLPTGEVLASEIAAYQGSWIGQMGTRAEGAVVFQTFLLVGALLWRAGGLMLIGMALLKLHVFSAKRSSAFYWTLVAVGAFTGVPTVIYGAHRNIALDWDFRACFFLGQMPNYWGSLLVSLGWVGLIMLMCKHGVLRRLSRLLANAGQMAFTNYILQTVICTTIFYGHGFGLFGRVERTGQIIIVLVICMVELLWSSLWLRRFRFGPLEWVWRSLTYWKRPPLYRHRAR